MNDIRTLSKSSHSSASPDSSTRTTIALAAGGTGGHLFPAEALARELLTRGHQVVIHTDQRGATYSQALAGLEHLVLPASHLQGGPIKKTRAMLTIMQAAWQARRDLKRRGASLLIGFGGYPSFAPALAAHSLGLPLILHEQASQLSKTNRQLLRWACALAVSFIETEGVQGCDPARIQQTGNPVRSSILAARTPYLAPTPDGPLRLLVIGGSQSAEVFGRIVPPALLGLPAHLRQRLHLALQYKGEQLKHIARPLRAGGIHADIRPFFDDIGERLRQAHLVITRAGASTAADIMTIGRPAIFVPLPHGGSGEEQMRNATTLAAAGAGWILPEPGLAAATLTERLATLFDTPATLSAAAQAASALALPNAATHLADLVEQHLH